MFSRIVLALPSWIASSTSAADGKWGTARSRKDENRNGGWECKLRLNIAGLFSNASYGKKFELQTFRILPSIPMTIWGVTFPGQSLWFEAIKSGIRHPWKKETNKICCTAASDLAEPEPVTSLFVDRALFLESGKHSFKQIFLAT